jgi:DNA repair protein RAD5
MADLDDRPQKKRRFFVDDSPAQDPSLTAEPSLPDEVNNSPETPTTRRQPSNLITNHDKENAFDAEAFKAFTGAEPPAETIASLQQTFGKDIERAINAYFDGSWKCQVVVSVRRLHSRTLQAVCRPRLEHVARHIHLQHRLQHRRP